MKKTGDLKKMHRLVSKRNEYLSFHCCVVLMVFESDMKVPSQLDIVYDSLSLLRINISLVSFLKEDHTYLMVNENFNFGG